MKNNFIRILFIVGLSHCHIGTFSQNVGIGTTTPHTSSKLEINSTNSGALIPRMSSAQRNAIVNPAVGLLIYDLDKFTIYMYNGHTWSPLIFGSNSTLPGLPFSASDGNASDLFGYAVSISGDYAIVGSPGDTVGVNARKFDDATGQVYGFYGIGAGISGYNLLIGALKNSQRGEVTFLNFE